MQQLSLGDAEYFCTMHQKLLRLLAESVDELSKAASADIVTLQKKHELLYGNKSSLVGANAPNAAAGEPVLSERDVAVVKNFLRNIDRQDGSSRT
jgi:hypothetical protein